MKIKSTLALAVGTVLFTALTGSGNAAPFSIAEIISFPGSPKADHRNHNAAKKGPAVAYTPSNQIPVSRPATPNKPLFHNLSGGNNHDFQRGSLGLDFHSPNAQVVSGFAKASPNKPDNHPKSQGRGNSSRQNPGKGGGPSTPPVVVPTPATNQVSDSGTSFMLLGFSLLGFGLLKLRTANLAT